MLTVLKKRFTIVTRTKTFCSQSWVLIFLVLKEFLVEGLSENRKSGGMVLAGVFLGSGVISAASQGIVGAVPQDKVNNYLESFAGEGVQSLDSTAVNYLKKHWKGILITLGLIVLAGLIIRKAFFSKKEGNVVDQFNLAKFDRLFCLEEEPKNIGGLGEKLYSFLGRVFTVKVGELKRMQFLDKDSLLRFDNIINNEGYKDEDELTVKVRQVKKKGLLYVDIFNDKNERISDVAPFFTKYVDAGKLGPFADYLDGKNIEVNFNSNLIYNE